MSSAVVLRYASKASRALIVSKYENMIRFGLTADLRWMVGTMSRLFWRLTASSGPQNDLKEMRADVGAVNPEAFRGDDQVVLKYGFELRANVKQLRGGCDDVGSAYRVIAALILGYLSDN
jgi:hypothetical protein